MHTAAKTACTGKREIIGRFSVMRRVVAGNRGRR
jgi:hypothetical protein